MSDYADHAAEAIFNLYEMSHYHPDSSVKAMASIIRENRDAEITRLRQIKAEFDELVIELGAAHREKESHIAKLEDEIMEGVQQISAQRTLIEEYEAEREHWPKTADGAPVPLVHVPGADLSAAYEPMVWVISINRKKVFQCRWSQWREWRCNRACYSSEQAAEAARQSK